MPFKDKEQYKLYMKEYMLKRYHTRRELAIQHLGGACVRCGSTENLQFDHIDPKTKTFSIAKLWSVNEVRFWNEVKLCQILCEPHHIEKTTVNGENRKRR